MNNFYKITKGQLITLWVFGIIFILGDLIYVLDQYSPSGFSIFLLLLIPAVLIFYTVGWKSHNPKAQKESKSLTENKENKEVIEIEYFNISPGKLVFLSIITFGIYELYWFYKNWEAVKKIENKKISPLGRAIFAVFYCYELFKKILINATAKGYDKKYSPGLLATFYIIILLLSNGLAKIPETEISNIPSEIFLFNLVWFGLSILTAIPLYIVQKAINYNNKKIKGEIADKKYTGGEIILIVIGVILTSLIFIGSFLPEESVEQQATDKVTNYFSQSEEWKVFNSALGQFQATFPTYPTHETDNIQIPDSSITLKYDSYLSETSDGTTYFVNTVTYSSEIDTSNPETNLEGSLNGMVASSEGNEVISSNFTYFEGYRALDYKIKNTSENIYLQGKIILVNQTLYQLMVAYESGNFNKNNYDKFINSFELN